MLFMVQVQDGFQARKQAAMNSDGENDSYVSMASGTDSDAPP